MSNCTCAKDYQITCIAHPTDLSLRQRIAELEAKVERIQCDGYDCCPLAPELNKADDEVERLREALWTIASDTQSSGEMVWTAKAALTQEGE